MFIAETAKPRQTDDLVTIGAIAIAAACFTTIAHEAMGHGGACLAFGGRITLLTSVYFECSPRSPWIAAAGPAGNFLAAAIAWLALKTVPVGMPRFRLLLLFTMAFSMFWEAGYLLYAMVMNKGDYVIAARAALGTPAWPWRLGGVMLGLVLYAVGIRAVAVAARPFTAGEFGLAPARVEVLLRLGWIAASVAACVAALAYVPDRFGAVGQAALELGAASLPLLILGAGITPGDKTIESAIPRSTGWIVFATALFLGFISTLGRGLPW